MSAGLPTTWSFPRIWARWSIGRRTRRLWRRFEVFGHAPRTRSFGVRAPPVKGLEENRRVFAWSIAEVSPARVVYYLKDRSFGAKLVCLSSLHNKRVGFHWGFRKELQATLACRRPSTKRSMLQLNRSFPVEAFFENSKKR